MRLTDQQRQRAEALIEWAFWRTDEVTAKIIWQEDRIRELEAINAELYEALEWAKSMLEEYEQEGTGECFNSPMINGALAKAEERRRRDE